MFIDSHCHLNFPCFDLQRKALLTALKEEQITSLIIPATHQTEWDKIIRMASKYSHLYYALGYHPRFLQYYRQGDLDELKLLLKNSDHRAVAIGEIGLDKFAKTAMPMQELLFIEQLKIAEKLQLPVILHIVKKQGRVLEILKQQKFTQGGVYHAFSGSFDVASAFIRLGFKIGIGGVITYPNSTTTRKTVSELPIDSLLLETDAPDMPVYQQKQSYNSPLNLPVIFESLLSLRRESKNCLATQILKNTCSIFSLTHD